MKPRTALAVLVGGLTVANLGRTALVPGPWHFTFNLGIGAFAGGVAWITGLTRTEMGLSRRSAPAGLKFGLGAAAAITTGVVGLGLAGALTDDRTDMSALTMLSRALVVIPLGTVVVEELAFRGTLHGLLRQTGSERWAWVAGATLFGLWHVYPTWMADRDAAMTVGTLVATTIAGTGFIWLRVRSDSVIAPAVAHFATNSVTLAVAWILR
ncbi:MAG: CPBP family intramembrane metalloprotease [Microthrixaceae bacterium]|jgi:membrane protease YdiL (CAAX protease family)|nr:CPBP family intramembrane metalloprotease [Microthrixaceae bacterium]